MNIKEAKEEIRRTVLAYTAKNKSGLYQIPPARQRPILLMGAPGIGKTAIVEQAARECGIAFLSYTMTHHTRQSAVGLPVIKEHTFSGKTYSVTEYTMSEIISGVHTIMEESGLSEGILFLDEINCVSETLMPSMLQFLQFKTFGNHKLPEGWIIAAAGNPVRYNRSARNLDVVTLDRVKYMEIQADLPSWKEYALSRNLHGAVLSYLDLKPEYFYVFRYSETGKEFVTPRGWEDLSNILDSYEALRLPVEETLFPQYLQSEEVSRDFASYYQLYRAFLQKPFLETLTNRGELMKEIPSFSESSADEKLCLISYLVHSIHRQISAWEDKRLLLQSLSYFIDSLYSHNLNFSNLDTACNELLSKRQAAMEKKKEFGLLPVKEEERELLFADTIHNYVTEARLTLIETDSQSLSPLPVMEHFLKTDLKNLEKEALRLEAVLRSSVQFINQSMGDGLEAFLFFTELPEHPETEAFLASRMKEEYSAYFNSVISP